MRLHAFQHVAFEDLGSIQSWCQKKGIETHTTRFFQNEPLPPLADVTHLVVLGGPMGVGDRAHLPWLEAEMQFIRRVIEAGGAVLGICLGAQLLAAALGARVYRNPEPEIGWFPVHRVSQAHADEATAFLPANLEVFHWHGDTFDLPVGTQRLAYSAACRNQGFYRGRRLIGLQFHLETTRSGVEALLTHCGNELVEGRPYIQSAATIGAVTDRFEPNQTVMRALLEKWIGSRPSSRGSGDAAIP
jgi:GMP synthase-like glutamine amidotransferase